MVEILKQNQYVPMDVEHQVAILYAGSQGILDDIPNKKIGEFEKGVCWITWMPIMRKCLKQLAAAVKYQMKPVRN